MTKLFFLFLLFSCATARKTSFPENAEIKVREFSSPKEAQNFIRNKSNYLKLLFEQSFDPYYGTPKWPLDCLAKNKISGVEEAQGNVFFSSELIQNPSGEAGFCEGNLRDVIFLQCKDEPRVYEINCPVGTCRNVLAGNPCPVKK